MTYQFTVPGPPQGKARPRTVRRGRRSTTYTPEKTVEYENAVRKAYRDIYGNGNTIPAKTPTSITIRAYYPIPKVSKAKRARMLSGEIKPTVKPDADNVIKIICDALNPKEEFNGAWRDDAQATDVVFKKRYDETPRVEVTIKGVMPV